MGSTSHNILIKIDYKLGNTNYFNYIALAIQLSCFILIINYCTHLQLIALVVTGQSVFENFLVYMKNKERTDKGKFKKVILLSTDEITEILNYYSKNHTLYGIEKFMSYSPYFLYKELNRLGYKFIKNKPTIGRKEKKCTVCKLIKPVTDFYKDKSRGDGFHSSCRNCSKEKNKKFSKEKARICPLFKIKRNIRTLILYEFNKKKNKKNHRTETILGCSFEEFKLYIESKFELWMNWENYGKYNGQLNFGWDLDHIIPISNAKTENDIYKLNHYTNFQPLCSYTNRYIKRNLWQ